jgi:hypothetical protein
MIRWAGSLNSLIHLSTSQYISYTSQYISAHLLRTSAQLSYTCHLSSLDHLPGQLSIPLASAVLVHLPAAQLSRSLATSAPIYITCQLSFPDHLPAQLSRSLASSALYIICQLSHISLASSALIYITCQLSSLDHLPAQLSRALAVQLSISLASSEQIRFGRVVIPNLTLPGNPGSNLIMITEIEIQFVFPDELRKLLWIITAAREHLPSAAQRGVFRHSPPISGSKLLSCQLSSHTLASSAL